MKKLTLFLFALLISCSAWAAQPAQLYLKPGTNWKKDGARFAAYFFGNGETWVDMTKLSNDLYVVNTPTNKTYPNVIFCRMNPSTTANNWNNKWNQTGDLTIATTSTGYNCFTVANNSWDGATTTWSKHYASVTINNSANFSVGDTFTPDVTTSNFTTVTKTHKMNDETFNNNYTFNDKGDFIFSVTAQEKDFTSISITETLTIKIIPTVKFNNKTTEYMVGETFTPSVSATKILNPTYTYKVNENAVTIPDGGYLFEEAGEYTFTVEVKHNSQGKVLAEDEFTVIVTETPPAHVYFQNDASTEYSVGSKFIPQVESENIANPTYTYKVNGNAVTIPDGGYLFEDQGTFVFKVEARNNGEGDELATATHTVTIEATVSFTNNKTDYSVGESFDFATTTTSILSPKHIYKVNDQEIDATKGYVFNDNGTYSFSVEAQYGDKTIVSAEKIVTINPTVTFTEPAETFVVGDKYFPTPATATKILNPTYTYKVNDEEIDPIKGYIFKNTGNFIFSVEVKNNGEGNVLASNEYKITISEMTPIYLKPNSNWTQANARFAIYYWDSKGGFYWVSMEKHTDNSYAAYIPNNCDGLIFVRINPSAQENSWDGKWNQTGDLTIPTDGKNTFTIPSGAWDNSTTTWSTYTPSKLYISGDLENEIEVKEGAASTTQTGAFPAGTYEVVVNDGTRYWQNATSITIEETVPTIDFSVDATTKEITVTPKNTFAEPSNLIIDTEYGNLTYQLSMPSDKWYWISLPFKVDIDEITTSTGNGAKDLVITYYDAKERATTGKGGWKNATEQGLTTLTANQGYVIGPKTTKENEGDKFPGMTVTFPSASPTNKVNSSAKDTLTSTGGNTQNDNWYIIGTGLYHQGSLSNINYVAMPAKNDKGEDTYEYKYISSGNELFTEKLGTNSFAPFTAFFVQYGGPYSATAPNAQSAALAPVARAKAQEQEQIYLINMNEAHTVVILNAEGSEGYTAGEDFLEMNASNHSDLIYSFDGSDALAFNHRALEAQSIALGGYVAVAGEQTISLKGYNANVESVTLVDNVTGETADLLAGDYTFNAEVGSLDGRFIVVFGAQKAGNTTVDCYNSTANQLIAYGSANACTVSGLITGEAVVVYNTMGQLVFATIADSETITLPSLTTGNYLILHNGTTNKVLLK